MRVTAAIPCYNGERFIAQTVESLLRQSRPADEIMVIDDGSTDCSAEIVHRFGPPVRLIEHQANKGLAQARNTAIRCAQGEIIVFVDADAWGDPNMVEALLAEFTGDDIAAVGGQGIEAKIETVYDHWRQKYLSQTSGDEHIAERGWIGGLCSAFRREALLKVGGFDPIYRTNAEDHDISYKLRQAGYRLVYTPYARVYHQRGDDWRSLLKMVYRYAYWRHVVMKRNGIQPPHTLYFYHAVRDCIRGVQRDLIKDNDPHLALISLTVLPVRLAAMARAAFRYRNLPTHLDADWVHVGIR